MSSLKLRRWRWAVAGVALAVTGCASAGTGPAGIPGPAGAASQDALRPPPLPLGAALYDTTWSGVPRERSGRVDAGWRLAFGGPLPNVMVIHGTRRCPHDAPLIYFEGKVLPCMTRIPALDEVVPGTRVRMRILRGRPAAAMFGTISQRRGVVILMIRGPEREG
jgi:hypothetical protein